MVVENNVPLQGLNTFHIVARAQQLLRIRSQDDVSALLQDAALAALAPALLVIGLAGEGRVENLLIWSQVILSLQLGFACWPLVRMTGDAELMGAFVAPRWIRVLGWIATAVVVSASLWFVVGAF